MRTPGSLTICQKILEVVIYFCLLFSSFCFGGRGPVKVLSCVCFPNLWSLVCSPARQLVACSPHITTIELLTGLLLPNVASSVVLFFFLHLTSSTLNCSFAGC
jgi:hypothetical protein